MVFYLELLPSREQSTRIIHHPTVSTFFFFSLLPLDFFSEGLRSPPPACMNLVIEGPAMNFRSQFKRLLPRKRSPEMKKSHSISVKSYDISLPRSPNRKTHDLSIAEYPIDKVKNSKPIKLKAQLRKWLESKRLLERVSEHKRCDASCSCQTTIGTEYAQPDPSCGM